MYIIMYLKKRQQMIQMFIVFCCILEYLLKLSIMIFLGYVLSW